MRVRKEQGMMKIVGGFANGFWDCHDKLAIQLNIHCWNGRSSTSLTQWKRNKILFLEVGFSVHVIWFGWDCCKLQHSLSLKLQYAQWCPNHLFKYACPEEDNWKVVTKEVKQRKNNGDRWLKISKENKRPPPTAPVAGNGRHRQSPISRHFSSLSRGSSLLTANN